nr:MAG TPA: hypothetical protein [Caudoviricetes sp.]
MFIHLSNTECLLSPLKRRGPVGQYYLGEWGGGEHYISLLSLDRT